MRFSLRIMSLTAVLAVLVIPALTTGLTAYRQVYYALEAGVEDRLDHEARRAGASTATALQSASNTAAAASNNIVLRDAVHRRNADLVYAVLKELQAEQKQFLEDAFVTDAAGEITATAALGRTPGLTLEDLGFSEQVPYGQAAFSEVTSSKITGKPVIAVIYPLVRDEDFVGMAGVTVDVAAVAQNAMQSGDGYMFNRSGYVVYHSQTDRMPGAHLQQGNEQQMQEIADAVVNGAGGRGRYTYNGEDILVAYAPAGQFFVAVTAPAGNYLEPAGAIRQKMVFAMLLGMAVSMLLVCILRKQMNKYAQEFTRAGRKTDEAGIAQCGAESEEAGRSLAFIRQQERLQQEIRFAMQQLAGVDEAATAVQEQINAASKEISCVVQDLSRGAESGGKAFAELSRSLTNSAGLEQLISTTAVAAKSSTCQTLAAADQGVAKVEAGIELIQQSKAQTEQESRFIAELEHGLRQIGEFNDLIAGIAARTDGLALNTAINAARVGEHGRDFVQIAEDIRKLAEQTGEKTREIGLLVDKIGDKTRGAATALEQNGLQLAKGVSVMRAAGDALARIIETQTQTAVYTEGSTAAITDETNRSALLSRISDEVAMIVRETVQQCGRLSAMSEDQGAAADTIKNCVQEIRFLEQRLKLFAEEAHAAGYKVSSRS